MSKYLYTIIPFSAFKFTKQGFSSIHCQAFDKLTYVERGVDSRYKTTNLPAARFSGVRLGTVLSDRPDLACGKLKESKCLSSYLKFISIS